VISVTSQESGKSLIKLFLAENTSEISGFQDFRETAASGLGQKESTSYARSTSRRVIPPDAEVFPARKS
jgi:hypothetical protein